MTKHVTILFYTLQPIDVEEKDFRLHVRAEDEQGVKTFKRWLHKNVYRRLYYYDWVTEYYTFKKLGKTILGRLQRNSLFQMVEGIPEL